MWITTWNVNGIRARKERVLNWIDSYFPAILCLQETRCKDADFPHSDVKKFYSHIIHTDEAKANGVAICSKYPMIDIDINPFRDDQHRAIAATINDHRIINLYVPQGQSLDSPKYPYKLQWWEDFYNWYEKQGLTYGFDKTIIVGDYNICPTTHDVWSQKYWHDGIVSCTPEERAMFKKFMDDWELKDAIRSLTDDKAFTWWGYMYWSRSKKPLSQGVRIDHVLHSKDLKPVAYHIDTEERSNHKGASDHAPVSVRFK